LQDPPLGAARKRSGSSAVREASADYLDAAPRRSPRGIVTSAATGQALFREGNRPQPTGPDEGNGDISLVARTGRRGSMRSRSARRADGLCVSSAPILRAVDSALVSASCALPAARRDGPGVAGFVRLRPPF
jgi:hypothetical protein